MGTFLSVRALHEEGVPNKEVARRLGIDVRTVRAYLRKIEGGMPEPARAVVPRLLERLVEGGGSCVHTHPNLGGNTRVFQSGAR